MKYGSRYYRALEKLKASYSISFI